MTVDQTRVQKDQPWTCAASADFACCPVAVTEQFQHEWFRLKSLLTSKPSLHHRLVQLSFAIIKFHLFCPHQIASKLLHRTHCRFCGACHVCGKNSNWVLYVATFLTQVDTYPQCRSKNPCIIAIQKFIICNRSRIKNLQATMMWNGPAASVFDLQDFQQPGYVAWAGGHIDSMLCELEFSLQVIDATFVTALKWSFNFELQVLRQFIMKTQNELLGTNNQQIIYMCRDVGLLLSVLENGALEIVKPMSCTYFHKELIPLRSCCTLTWETSTQNPKLMFFTLLLLCPKWNFNQDCGSLRNL